MQRRRPSSLAVLGIIFLEALHSPCAAQPEDCAPTEEEFSALQRGRTASGSVRLPAVPNQQKGTGERYRQTLFNYADIEYTGKVSVGGQKLRAIFDTGSYELLVFSKACTSQNCMFNPHFYNQNDSTSLVPLNWTRTHSFGSGDALSKLAIDKVSIGPYRAYQSFWQVLDANMAILQDGTFEAIFGVGNPHEPRTEVAGFLTEDAIKIQHCASTKDGCPAWLRKQSADDKSFYEDVQALPPWLENLHLNRFSVCFLRGSGLEGFFVWNDYDPEMHPYGQAFRRLTVTGVSTWSVGLTDAHLMGHGTRWCTVPGQCQAILDSGTSLLTAPSGVVQALQSKLSLTKGDCSDLTSMPHLKFTLNGSHISLPPESYIGTVEGELAHEMHAFFPHLRSTTVQERGGKCQLLIMSVDMQSQKGKINWILGMPFFREFYTMFDFGNDNKYRTRNIYIAKADEGCNHPSEKGSSPEGTILRSDDAESLDQPVAIKRTPKHINLSKLKPPQWTQHTRALTTERTRL